MDKRWKTKVRRADSIEAAEKIFNELGIGGWEPVSLQAYSSSEIFTDRGKVVGSCSRDHFILTVKREIPEQPTPESPASPDEEDYSRGSNVG